MSAFANREISSSLIDCRLSHGRLNGRICPRPGRRGGQGHHACAGTPAGACGPPGDGAEDDSSQGRCADRADKAAEVWLRIERVEQEGDKRLSDYRFIKGPSRLHHLSPVEGNPGWPPCGRLARPFVLSPFHNLSSDREQPGCPSLRTSSKHIPIVRTADSTPPLLQRGGRGLLNCARRARPFRGRALREHRAILDCLATHFLSFIARSTSRLASRLLMDARRSCCFLPLANPSSTLARPRVEK